MKNAKKLTVLILMIVSLAALFSSQVPAFGAPAEVIELKLGHPLVPSGSPNIYMEKWAELVKERSNGKYVITVYPSAQFGEAREMVESLSMGTYELTWCDTAAMDFIIPEMAMLYMPFFIQSNEELWKLVDGEFGEWLKQACIEKANIHPLTYFTQGPRHIFSRTEIKDLASLHNVKVRVPEQDLWIETFATLGMNPTPIAWSELYTALESKLCDAGCSTWENIALQQMYTQAPYIWESCHFYQTGVLSFNEDFWQTLPEEDKKMFEETCYEMALEQRKHLASMEEEYKKTVTDGNGKILPLRDFVDLDEVYALYENGLWKSIIENAGGEEVYATMKKVLGR